MPSPIPSNEMARLEALARYRVLDTPPEGSFERITALAARLFEVPIALVTLLDQDRVWFKSCFGVEAAGVERDGAFCAHTILQDNVFVVPDAAEDSRFSQSPVVVNAPFARFYAGAPLTTADGFRLGSLCLIDQVPRTFTAAQQDTLRDLAAMVVEVLEARRTASLMAGEIAERQSAVARKNAVLDAALDGIITIDHQGQVLELNHAAETMFGYPAERAVGQELAELIIPPAYREAHRRGMAHFLTTGEGPVLNKRLELSAVNAAGKEFPIELAITRIVAEGPPVFTGHIRDISARREREKWLWMLESSVAHANDAILIAEPEGADGKLPRILYVNRAFTQTTGYSSEEVVGQSPQILYGPETDAATLAKIFQAMAERQPLNAEMLNYRKDGTKFWVELNLVPVADERGRISHWVSVRRDITERKRIEANLRENEERLSLALQTARIGSWDMNLETRQTVWSAEHNRMFDLPPDQRVGVLEQWLERVHPEDRQKPSDALPAAMEAGQDYENELRAVHRDGSVHWIAGKVRGFRNEAGKLVRLLGTVRDITERKQFEAQREESARLAAMGAEIGLALTRHDALSDVLHRCAEVLVHRLGAAFARVWTLNEATNVLELQASAGLYTHLDGPHSRVPVGKFKIGLIAQERLPHLTNQVVGDPRVGNQAWARENGMVAFAGYPLIVDDRVVGVLALFSREALSQTAFQALESIANAVAVGIEHRMSQAERGALARQVSLLLESTAEGVCGVDLQGCVTFINRSGAQTLGYQPEEMLGQPMHLLAHHHHADGSVYPAEDCPVYQTVKSGQSVRVDDDVFWRRDGTSFPVEYACAAIREDGQIRGAVYTFADITARKRAEAALLQTKVRAEEAQAEAERANLAKSEFLSRMSHELRTPLNAILGFGQLLEMDAQSDRQREKLSHILQGGKHLLGLINEVLDIARIESGKMELTPEAVSVAEIFHGAAALIRPLADQRNIRLGRCTGAACEGSMWADRQRLSQVVINLLSNAVKYNRPGGSVSLTCEPSAQPGRLRLAVSDTGPGIAPDDLTKLFTPFERLGAEQSNVEGTGIGLALCKGLIEAMGGSIGVESAVGRGSTFYFDLPSSTSSSRRDENAPGPEPVRLPAGQHTILCIEDNLANFALIEQVLEEKRPGVRLLGAMRGQLGMEMAREHRPDLILLDLQLPDISGDKVLRLLQADAATRDIPVIMVSADATKGQSQRLLNLGAQSYLTKPIDIRMFLRTVDDALNNRSAVLLGSGSNL